MLRKNLTDHRRHTVSPARQAAAAGFSLVEVIVAMVILLVALLAVITAFTYVVNYNAGNSTRTQALSVLKQETELLRGAKFTPFFTDGNLAGGAQAAKTVAGENQDIFRVTVVVDDDPFAAGTQINATTTLKEVLITVEPENSRAGWQTAVPVTTVLRRVRTN